MKKFIAGLIAAGFSIGALPLNILAEEHYLVIDQDLSKYGDNLEEVAQKKLDEFKILVEKAKVNGVEITREETVIDAAETFIKGAKWDAQNFQALKENFSSLWYAKSNSDDLAAKIPSLEYFQVCEMLEKATSDLEKVMDGFYTRRDVPEIDWTQVHLDGSNYTYKDHVVFPFSYIWKSESQHGDLLGHISAGYTDHAKTFDSLTKIDDIMVAMHLSYSSDNIAAFMFGHKAIPKFMKDAYPEATALGYSDYVAYDRNDPVMIDYTKRMIEAVGAKNAELGRNLDLGYTLANEPHWVSAQGEWYVRQGKEGKITEHTMKKFRDYLATSYNNNITALNNNWDTNFANFASVELEVPIDPALEGRPQWYDYITFHKQDVTEFFAMMQEALLSADPNAQTSIKLIPEYFLNPQSVGGIDFEALTELTTMIGDDSGINKEEVSDVGKNLGWNNTYEYEWLPLAIPYDFMWSVAPDKAHINSENHNISKGQWRDLQMNPELARSTYWLQTILGMDASQFWVWGRKDDGSIDLNKLGSALVGSSSQMPLVTNEIAQTAHDLNAFGAEVAALQARNRPIRMFHSETNVSVDTSKINSMEELYQKLYFSEVGIGFATENIIKKQDNSQWSTILVYDTPYVKDSEFDALQQYLDNGGTVIIDNASLKYNQYKQPRSASLTGNVIIVTDDVLTNMHTEAFKILDTKGTAPVITASEVNGLDQETAFVAVAQMSEKEYVLSITQLGKNPSEINLTANGAEIESVVNLFTGVTISPSNIVLNPENMKFLKVILK